MNRFFKLLILFLSFFTSLNAKVIQGDCGTGMQWSFDDQTGMLSFSGSGSMYDYTNGTPWASLRNDIRAVSLSDEVSNMPYYALLGCYSVEKIIVGNSSHFYSMGNCLITKNDSTLVFAGKDFEIPQLVRTIGPKAFYSHPTLSALTLPMGVHTISEQSFAKCSALKTVSMPSTLKAISIGAFFECTSLTSVQLPEGLRVIARQAFARCSSLSEITLPSTLTGLGIAVFAACTSLSDISIPPHVTAIGMGLFQNCVSLKSLTIPDSVTLIDQLAFENCTSLESVSIPATVQTIAETAFKGCVNLNALMVDARNENYCVVDNKIQKKEQPLRDREFQAFIDEAKALRSAKLKLLKLSEEHDQKYPELSKQVTVQKAGTLETHFTQSEKQTVTTLTISGPLDGSDIAFIRKMSGFRDEADQSDWIGGSLRVLDISSAIIVKSKNIYIVSTPQGIWHRLSWKQSENGFRSNFKSESWDFDTMTQKEFADFKRSVNTNKYGMHFEYCGDNKVKAHHFCLKNVIGDKMFSECVSLRTLILPPSVTKISSEAFANSVQLSTIRIPHKLMEISTDAFVGCLSLSRVEIPIDNKVALSAVPYDATFFYYNPKKKSSVPSVLPVPATDVAHEYVDLGLPSGTLWAKCNVGAANEWQIGSYFAWGEIFPKKRYSAETYFDLESRLISYPQDIIGTEYDAATHHWGDEWVMPTRAQANELYSKCKWIWTNDYQSSGQSGCICQGPNGNFIFFPAGGVIMDGKHSYKGSGNIWTGDLDIFNHFEWAGFINFDKNGLVAHALIVNGTKLYASHDYRWWGRNVRPVRKK